MKKSPFFVINIKIVAESFYDGYKAPLKAHTTTSGYANLSGMQGIFAEDISSEPNF